MLEAQTKPLVYLSAITSDIGTALATRYSQDGYAVAGTYRSGELQPELTDLPDCHLAYCDLADPASIAESVEHFAALGLVWETFISCAGWPRPLSPFFDGDVDVWSASVHVNAIEQLRVVHCLYPYRDTGAIANVVFFAGAGTNGPVTGFSAYCVSKIMLIKMCELIHAENADLNAFIIGPGWTRTKIHDEVLNAPEAAASKRAETAGFLRDGEGTSMDDIYAQIRWFSQQGREVAGGRNSSTVHDPWGLDELGQALRADPDMYRLRRSGSEWAARAERNRDE